MPGGRPRKYADAAAAKAAGRLRAIERRAERKAARENGEIKDEGDYRFILEDIVCLGCVSSGIALFLFSGNIVSNANIIDRASGQLPASHHSHLSASPQAQ
jgi:hypothetical protein